MDTPRASATSGSSPIGWAISDQPVPYVQALEAMNARADAIRRKEAPQLVWLLEHPPLYTAGTSARREDLLDPNRFPVFETGRGGQFTYHGPGQRVAYVMLDMKARGGDVRGLVADLERWVIEALSALNIKGERREGRVGIWVRRPDKGENREDKIAAIGLRVSRWVTTHGISFNVEPELSHYTGIVPCGIQAHGVTSLADLGLPVSMTDADVALRLAFEKVFGPVASTEPPV
ncbi:MAG: lipoyl(octanoyl) transferase LipB [Hyphomicrobium sp.]|nr:lipoyl(octanoyl) transferase LipB [Hyphomicrobium sp.]